MGMLLTVGFLMFWVLGGCFAIYFILAMLKTNRLRLRDPIDKTRYIADFWVWEKKDNQTGVVYWQSVFWQPRIKTPVPPAKAIDVGTRGRKFAEAYKLSEDEFVWIADKGIKITEEVDPKTKKVTKQIVDVDKEGKEKIIDTFKPFTTTQRDTLINQHKKAAEISANRWTPDKIIAGGSLMMLMILIILIIIYWGELAAPILNMQGQNNAMMDKVDRITANQAEITKALGKDLPGYKATPQVIQQAQTGDVKVSTDPINKIIGTW